MKLGIAGTGMIVGEFLTITPSLKQIELCGIWGRSHKEDVMKQWQSQYGIGELFFAYEELLESEADTIYIALPNDLHFEYAKKALEAGKNVIVEKPMTTNYRQALILSELARSRNLYLFEGITNQYLPNYLKIKELLPRIGNVKIVQCNFSQYSSRYDRFLAGEVLPAFDPDHAGGALMDINIYNIHYVTGLFGIPNEISYHPNIQKGIDTSGILILDYEDFKCVCIGAKDSKAPIAYTIQGDKGCIYQDSPANTCEGFTLMLNDKTIESYQENIHSHRMIDEFLAFFEMMTQGDMTRCNLMLDHSLLVSKIQTKARMRSGILFPDDVVV